MGFEMSPQTVEYGNQVKFSGSSLSRTDVEVARGG